MKLRTKAAWSLAVAFCFALLSVTSAGAQTVTTGNITGTVTDAQGGVLPGATVVATHTDTGTNYEAVTGGDGRYIDPQRPRRRVRRHRQHERLQGSEAGQGAGAARRRADRRLQAGARVGQRDGRRRANTPLIDLARAGTADNISNAVKEIAADDLPQPRRRRPHQPDVQLLGGGSARDSASVVSVAGNSPRYNACRSTARPTTTSSAWRARRVRPAARRRRSRSASTRSRRFSWSSRRTTSARAASPAAASTRSPRAARTASTAPASTSAATRTGSARASPDTKISTLQGQAGRLQPRRPDHEEQGLLLRHGGLRPQGTPDRLLGQPGRPDHRKRGAGRSRSSTISRPSTATRSRAIRWRRVHQADQQRQVLRPRRLQRRQGTPAHGAPQLHRRVQRHHVTPLNSYRLPDAGHSIATSARPTRRSAS